MDKVYIDNSKNRSCRITKIWEVKLIVKDGKVVKYDTITSHVLPKN